jgi:hypothetical protein
MQVLIVLIKIEISENGMYLACIHGNNEIIRQCILLQFKQIKKTTNN